MSYKTILVHTDPGAGAAARVRLAARLARRHEAHLIGTALTGVSRFLPASTLAAGGPALAAHVAARRAGAARALAEFGALAAQEGVASREARLVNDEADGGLALQARYADLVVAGQRDRGLVDPSLPDDLGEYVLLHSGRPVLLTPPHALPPGAGAVLAWDGSTAAARAASGALPLLRDAAPVTVLGYAREPGGEDEARAGCAALAAWLGRHGIAARAEARPPQDEVGEALLAAVAALGAGLLVMGGYGTTRLREVLLGGTTTTVLRGMTVPVLMAH